VQTLRAGWPRPPGQARSGAVINRVAGEIEGREAGPERPKQRKAAQTLAGKEAYHGCKLLLVVGCTIAPCRPH
jgi:hypothetical protein